MARISAIFLLTVFAFAPLLSMGQVPDSVKRALAARDYEYAAGWLQAHREEPEAAFELARLYRLGRGVNQNADQAAALFEVAALAGHREAQYLLGKHFERKADLVVATRWMREAANAGDQRARQWLTDKASTYPEVDLFSELHRGRPPPVEAAGRALSTRGPSGRTLLMIASENNVPGWVDFLIDEGADLDLQDQFGATALHIAFAARHFGVAGRLLEAGADATAATGDGTTALHQAVAAGEINLARQLLHNGADADARNQAGWSPRMLSERSDTIAVQRLFAETAGDLDSSGSEVTDPSQRRSLMSQAIRRGDADLLQRLLIELDGDGAAFEDGDLLVHRAVEAGDAEILRLLLGSGFPGDKPNAQGQSPLMLATVAGCTACAAVLIAAGADVDHVDVEGMSALIVAARGGQTDIAGALIASGADLNLTDALGRTALWWASRAGFAALALDLLGRAALPAADRDGVSPLHLAAELDDAVLVSGLTLGVDVDIRSGGGSTPLLLAAHAGAEDAASGLIEAGADIEARNSAGDTALIAAVRAGHLGTSELLVQAGANPNTRNQRFESAAEIMASRQEPEWQALLTQADQGMLEVLGSLSN